MWWRPRALNKAADLVADVGHQGDFAYRIPDDDMAEILSIDNPNNLTGIYIRCFSDGGMRGSSTVCGAVCAVWCRGEWRVVEAVAFQLSASGDATVPEAEHTGVAWATILAERMRRRIARRPERMQSDPVLPRQMMSSGVIAEAQLLINVAWHQ